MGLYGGLVAVVGCSLDQIGRRPGPPHHQLVDYAWVHRVHGQHALDELERRCWVVLGEQRLGQGRSRHDLWPLLQEGKISRARSR